MTRASHEKIIQIPMSVFESADSKEDLEDWLISHDADFIEELRRIKTEADQGKGRPLSELAKKWNIKP
ncbi:MAG: hypothetical protein HY877_08430 [Deltaproteobacteria bacterium]|nr:hypothetical protein [Deltaproteobacteria bacterium]